MKAKCGVREARCKYSTHDRKAADSPSDIDIGGGVQSRLRIIRDKMQRWQKESIHLIQQEVMDGQKNHLAAG